MNDPLRCPVCGTPLPANRLAGLCPACAWKAITEVDSETPAPTVPAAPGITLAVPGHIVLEEIARGGMGIVYRARQLDPERTVALKMMLPQQLRSAVFRERFRTEVRALTGLDHPGILPVYQVSELEGMPYFTMKLVTGGTLAQRKPGFAGRWRDIAGLVASVADAVQFAHERGVLHRDLKPGNVLFDDTGRPYVSDFGLAKLISVETDLTRSTDFLGTPHYVAPEVATRSARQATTSSDIYSLGAILYELLAGRPPFEAEGLPGLLKKIVEDEPAQPGAGVPRDLGVICLKCLAKEPARRYTSARDLADDLRRWLEGRPVLARPAGPVERIWFWSRRHPALASLSALLALTLVVGALLQARSNRSLRQALAESHLAQAAAQENLQQTLVAQARAERTSGWVGQRYKAMEAITGAVHIRPSLAARNEAAAAMATPDLRIVQTVPRFFANSQSTMDFSTNLDSYVTGRPEGGFMLRFPTNDAIMAFSTNHSYSAHRFKLSKEGGFVAAMYLNGELEVWSLSPPHLVWRSEAGDEAAAMPAFGPHDDGFTFAQPDGSVAWQSLATNRVRVLTPPGAKVKGISLSPTGQVIALVRTGVLELHDFATGEILWRLDGDFSTPEPAWSPEGEQLAVGDETNDSILLINARTGAVGRQLQAEGLKPTLLSFHPDGRRLASVGENRTLRLWDTRTGAVQWQGGAAPRVLQFSTNGRRLAFAPGHLDVALAELAPEDVWRELQTQQPGRASFSTWVDVSADNRLVVTCGEGEIRLWDARAGRQIQSFPFATGPLSSVFFHPDGHSLIYSGFGHGVLRRELQAHEDSDNRLLTVELGGEQPLAPTRDGLLISLGPDGRHWLIERRNQQQVVLWPDGDPKQERLLMTGHRFNGATLSRDGHWLATLAAPLPGVEIWDATKASLFTNLVLRGHAACQFSLDGQFLLTGTSMAYELWAVAGWNTVTNWPATLNGRSSGRVFFSPAGDRVAVEQDRGRLQICDTHDYRELVTLEPPRPIDIASAAWSPDGRQLFVLSARHRLYVWNMAKLREELAALGLDW